MSSPPGRPLRVYTFSPGWGLPAGGPFDLKLLSWLKLAGIEFDQVIEDNPRKGPKGKSPWIELEGEKIGDTEIIIEALSRRYGVDLNADLTPEQNAVGHAWRRTFEEHFHQVLEWELLIHPAGAAYLKTAMAKQAPPVARDLIWSLVRSHFRRQLFARGISRHPPEVIEAKGRADVDALADYLQGRSFLVAEHPTAHDAAVFGLLAPIVYWTMPTPVASYARTVPRIAAYVDQMRQRCFGA